jgi:hypothetical protein
MKKLRIEDLDIQSFDTTSTSHTLRGTVNGASGDYNDTCQAQNTLCGNQCNDDSGLCGGTADGSNCCHPYDVSLDWTFCQTECCNDSNAWTCANYGCTP